ncbi:MAG: phage tail sheath C-terminal domain-containing protein [Candidatus Solibacter sp.]
MPVTPTYPGVYIEEVRSGVRTITGVPTSITAFVGRALRGPVDDPLRISSFADFTRIFGGLSSSSLMSYSVQQYYQNGGSEAVIVRVDNGGVAASIGLPSGTVVGPTIRAGSRGLWGNSLRARVDRASGGTYDLFVRDMGSGAEERYFSVDNSGSGPRALVNLLQSSQLVEYVSAGAGAPSAHVAVPSGDWFTETATPPTQYTQATLGLDGSDITLTEVEGDETLKTGIYALLKTDIFNLLVIPPYTSAAEPTAGTLDKAAKLCADKRAMLLVDAPAAWTVADASGSARDSFVQTFSTTNQRNVALYFPRLRIADPNQGGALATFAPSGALAGIFARTDGERGVWKAPAGTDAGLGGVSELTVKLTDAENGRLNPLAVNCIRTFPVYGTIVWGSRTLRGADALADDDYKYVPVRRLTLFLEESLFRATQWVVFEPNDEPLWSQIRLNVGAFLNSLFRQGAFQGRSPREAYFVKCDSETTTQNDINRGIVNIVVGFAPLKPAEFVIIKIQQMAGDIAV